MNIVVFGLIIILATNTDCLLHQKPENVLQEKTQNVIFLRKLQTIIRSGSDEEARSLSWSEILADILVNKIGLSKIIPKENEQVAESDGKQDNIFTKICSTVLKVYKHFVYDKFFQQSAEDIPTSTSKIEITEKNIELQEIESNTPGANDFDVITINPDVEIIEPKYHGKLCLNCEIQNVEKKEVTSKSDCSENLVKDVNGNCVDPKSLNYMISIPYQCPIGYRLTWSGYCRPIF
ncbi:hypothetical protein RR48_07019 [Papilio machaon]|uniref:Chitin-binding type-2 domain-containing protein n=1 Tax=Papilio machaon TaxID=76193 RepID=A0A194R9T7_PAPMA|nr:hypothetical protein RR48_07019 [Papilio machaon]